MKAKTIVTLLVTVIFLGFSTPLWAQTGAVRGVVTDPDGNPLENVTIRIEAMRMNRKYKVKTNKKGEFYHGGVNRQSTYRVIAEKEGFQSNYVEGVTPPAERRGSVVDFTLTPGKSGRLAFEMTDEERAAAEAAAEGSTGVAAEVKLHMEEGILQYNQGQYELALEAFSAAVELDEAQPALWANLGNTHSKLNANDEALAAYQRAVALAPEDPNLLQNMGGIYAAMGDTEMARQTYEKAAGMAKYGDPKDAAANYYNMGVTFINAGKNDEAVESLLKAVESDPTYAEAYYQLGVCYLGLNQMDESVNALKKYLEIAPSGPNAEVAQQLVSQLAP